MIAADRGDGLFCGERRACVPGSWVEAYLGGQGA